MITNKRGKDEKTIIGTTRIKLSYINGIGK